MEFWEAEHDAKGKLSRIVSARDIISRLVSQWLMGVRQKSVERQAWYDFLSHYSDQEQLHNVLEGSVKYEEFIDLVEEAYRLPISESLGTLIFSDFEDFADRVATTSEEAVQASHAHLLKQIAVLRTQLWYLRFKSRKIWGRDLKVNITRRSHVVILLCILKGYADGGLDKAAWSESESAETNAKVAQLLLSARTFEVNASAAFCALQAYGIRVGKS